MSLEVRIGKLLARAAPATAVAVLLIWNFPAVAQERILAFTSDIRIVADGSMEVIETIRVRADGDMIRRGIFRDFPTDYRDRLGNRFTVDFDVRGVTRDGRAEPWFTESRSNGVRLYAGDENVFLAPGEYEYRLAYTTNFQIGYFADHDELYWNVTGNGWDFRIDAASAQVTLPADVGAAALSIEGYTGAAGSTESAVQTVIENGRTARIESSRQLRPREGLTLVMSWPKGVIAEPNALDRLARLLADNIGLLLALACLGVVTFYLVSVWRRYGRDPGAGPIFPHYEPPDGVSPAAARHIARMGYDRKAFTTAIISLAVKGYVEIDESGDEYTLRAVRGTGSQPLSRGERSLHERLFADSDTVILDNKNHRTLLKAMYAHGRALKRENFGVYFVTNSILLLPAIAMIVGTFIAIVVLQALTLFALASMVLAVLLVPVFAWLLKAPTRVGRRLLDRVEGFRLYLDVAEKDELELRHPPEKTPELFEAYLPYALALDVEQSWAEKFDGVFAGLQARTGQPYAPRWYHGQWRHDGFGSSTASMTAGMTDALGSAIASASTPPGSSSGGGGGGFSGGGGGGGGGGGW